jgi:hypothetical protein
MCSVAILGAWALVGLVGAGLPPDSPATDVNPASKLACDSLPPGWVAAESSRVCEREKYIDLPGTPAYASIPDGWVCSADGVMLFEEQEANVVECIPEKGGQPISLEREMGSHIPVSLDAYLREQEEELAIIPRRNIVVEPRRIEVGGHAAVEVATTSVAFFDGPEGGSQGTMLSHRITIEDVSGYYACSLTASTGYYDEQLRSVFFRFCTSIRFANTVKG